MRRLLAMTRGIARKQAATFLSTFAAQPFSDSVQTVEIHRASLRSISTDPLLSRQVLAIRLLLFFLIPFLLVHTDAPTLNYPKLTINGVLLEGAYERADRIMNVVRADP